ncbi:MAG: DMT family transporter [Clostridia bacterium]|nr:DMT family transporter [Clostridia bacterium]
METRHYELLLAAVIMARSSSYLFSKICLQSMGAFTLLAIRFLLALFGRKLKGITPHTAVRGVILGTIFFAVMAAELGGLRTTDSAAASFLENTAIVFVPFIEAVLHKKAPGSRVLLCGALTLAGVGLLTIRDGGFALRTGELLCLLAAGLYAVAIIATDRFSHSDDPLALGVIQVGVIGLLGLAAAMLLERPQLPAARTEWGCILYLSIVCTGFGFTLQPLAQSRTSAEKAGMFCAFNPLTASVLGVVFLHEGFAWTHVLGAALILCSIVVYGRYKARGVPARGRAG